MDLKLQRMFLFQVHFQCEALLTAANETNAALERHDPQAVFYALQNLLTAGANISKALWGSKGKRASARLPLRERLAVADDSPLRDPDMRNNFEHFDERLEKWWADSTAHGAIDLCIGPKSEWGSGPDIDRFRIFDPSTTAILFWGDTFNLQSLVREATRIRPRALEEALKLQIPSGS